MKKSIVTLLATAGILASPAMGKVAFSLDIESLTDGGGSGLSNSGLLVLVADTSGGDIVLPSAGSFGEDVVATWDLSTVGPGTTDITLHTKDGVSFDPDWEAGDPLVLYWFPELADSELPSATEPYGLFTDGLGVTSGESWTMPENGAIRNLKLLTETASQLSSFGDVPAGAGMAAFSVDNPPSASTNPSGLAVVNSGDGAVNLSWADSGAAPAGGYIVQRKRTGTSVWQTIGFTNSETRAFSDDTILPGLAYDYQVFSQGGVSIAQSDSQPEIEAERSIFINLAARGHIDPDSANRDWTLMNAGIVLTGNDPLKRMLGLGIGPYNRNRLNQPWLEDTTMVLEIGGETVAENDNWMRDSDDPNAPNPDVVALDAAMAARGTPLLPVDDSDTGFIGMDSALIENIALGPNLFKIFSKETTGEAGFAGIQVYDAEYVGGDNPVINDNRIVNLSTKGLLGENGVFNGSLVISGPVPKEVLVLARGPALALKGVAATLEDPILILKRGADVLSENDDWDNQTATTNVARGLLKTETDINRIRAAISRIGQNPDDHTTDSAMLVTLAPGSEGYIFKVEAAPGSTVVEGTVQIQINEIEMD